MNQKQHFWNFAKNVDLVIASLSIAILVLLTALGSVTRYFFRSPIIWLEEVQMILFVWVAFFGSSVAFRKGGHIAIEIIFDLFPIKMQKAVNLLIFAVVSLALAFMTWQELLRALSLLDTGRTTNILHIPLCFNYFGVSAACLLMLVNFVAGQFGSTKHPKQEEHTP